MFKKRNLLSIFLILSFFIFGDIAMAVIPRAKVIFLGETGSGKTTLKAILAGKKPSNAYKHTVQLDMEEQEFNVSGKIVFAHMWDTTAEMRHREIVNEFCKNAHVAVLCMAADTLVNSDFTKGIEGTMENLAKNAPKCRIIIVLTKTKGQKVSPIQVNKAKDYIKNILIGDTLKDYVDGWYEFPDLNSSSLKDCSEKLTKMLECSLEKWGYENLPKEAKGMHGVIEEYWVDSKDIVDEEYEDYEWVDGEAPDPSTCDDERKKKVSVKIPKLKVRKVLKDQKVKKYRLKTY